MRYSQYEGTLILLNKIERGHRTTCLGLAFQAVVEIITDPDPGDNQQREKSDDVIDGHHELKQTTFPRPLKTNRQEH